MNLGGRGGARTPDPLLAKQVLSQLSYTPTALSIFKARSVWVKRVCLFRMISDSRTERQDESHKMG